MIWTKSDVDELDVRAAELVFHGDVHRVTPSVVDEHSEPPFFLLLAVVSLLARTVWKLGMVALESSICTCSHVSVKHMILDSLTPAASRQALPVRPILFARDFTFPVIFAGMQGLNFAVSSIAPSILSVSPRRRGFGASGSSAGRDCKQCRL